MRPLIFAAILALSCTKKPAAPAAGETSEPTRPLLLWRVQRNDAVSYLMGTCHLPIPLAHALPSPHDAALANARAMITELDVLALTDPTTAVKLLWDDDYNLKEALGPDFLAISKHHRTTLPAPTLVRFHPWVVYYIPSPEDLQAQQQTPALDAAASVLAATNGVSRIYLETAEEQTALLSQFDDAFLELLRPGSDGDEQSATQQQALREACISGELAQIERLLDDPEQVEAYGALLDARNEAWIPKILPEAEQGGAFVAVGAAHMVGPTGLVEQLRRHGFDVTQLSTTRPPAATPEDLPTFGGTPAPATSDPAKVSAWTEFWAKPDGPLAAVCTEGAVLSTCFAGSPTQCHAAITSDLPLCVEQWEDELPASPAEDVDLGTQQMVLGCAASGLMLSAVAQDRVSDDPACQAVVEAMQPGGPQ